MHNRVKEFYDPQPSGGGVFSINSLFNMGCEVLELVHYESNIKLYFIEFIYLVAFPQRSILQLYN